MNSKRSIAIVSCTKRCLLFVLSAFIALATLGAVSLYFAARWLNNADAPQKADAIVVLAGDLTRAFEAAQLYRDGYAPRVYLSAAVRDPSLLLLDREGVVFPRLEEVTLQILLQKGVPSDAIRWLAKDMMSTATEAAATRAVVDSGERRILVITSPYHTRRTGIIFRNALPGADVRVVASRYEEFPEHWWREQLAARNVLLETAKLAFYYTGGRF